jgi:hypothetical protein
VRFSIVSAESAFGKRALDFPLDRTSAFRFSCIRLCGDSEIVLELTDGIPALRKFVSSTCPVRWDGRPSGMSRSFFPSRSLNVAPQGEKLIGAVSSLWLLTVNWSALSTHWRGHIKPSELPSPKRSPRMVCGKNLSRPLQTLAACMPYHRAPRQR